MSLAKVVNISYTNNCNLYNLDELPNVAVESLTEVKTTQEIRTATGGWINTIMIFLTLVAFCGNGLFLCYVFWLSK